MFKKTLISLFSLIAVFALAIPAAASAAGGGAVLFSKTSTVDGKAKGGLYAVKDGHLNQLTEDPTDSEPNFSPDGRTVAFVRGGDIFSIRPDGSGQRQLTSGPEVDSLPKIAPNGRYLVFERRGALGGPSGLYSVRVTGGGEHGVVTGGDNHEAAFAPDGKTIVFVRSTPGANGGNDDLYTVRPSGNEQRRLTRTAADEFAPRYFAGGIVYSRGENGEGDSAFADIYTMRRNGQKARSQVAGAGSAYVEDVSPNGRTLLFRREQGLWVKRIGDGAARKLTELPDESQTNAVFSSDGKRVAAFIEADERTQLSSISVADGSDRELAQGVVPTETTPTSGIVTTLGPVIAWQPSR